MRPFKQTIVVVVLAVVSLVSQGLARELEYTVFSENKRLGSINVIEEPGWDIDTTQLVVQTRLRAKVLFVTTFSLDSKAIYSLDKAGLCRFKILDNIDGEQITTVGVRGHRAFTLEIETKDGQEVHEIMHDKYDISSVTDPVEKLAEAGTRYAFLVFDLDRLEVVERSFTWIRDEKVEVDGQSLACQVIDVSDKHGKSRRWIVRDSEHTLVREEGADEDGPFRVVLNHYPGSGL